MCRIFKFVFEAVCCAVSSVLLNDQCELEKRADNYIVSEKVAVADDMWELGNETLLSARAWNVHERTAVVEAPGGSPTHVLLPSCLCR